MRKKRAEGEDYIFEKDDERVWIEVGKIVVSVRKTDEGVVVDLYANGRENDDALAGTYAFFEEITDDHDEAKERETVAAGNTVAVVETPELRRFIFSVTEETIYTVAVEAVTEQAASEEVHTVCDDGQYYGEDGYIETQSEYTAVRLLETKQIAAGGVPLDGRTA